MDAQQLPSVVDTVDLPDLGLRPGKPERQWRAITVDGFGDATEEGFWWILSSGGRLYVNSWNSVKGGAVYRSDLAGENFERISPHGFGNPENWSLLGMDFFEECLYTATWNTAEGGEIWRTCDPEDGSPSWEIVVDDGFGDPTHHTAGTHLIAGDGYLNAGTYQPFEGSGPRIYRSESGDPGSWFQLGPDNYAVEDGLSDASVGLFYENMYFTGNESQLFAKPRQPKLGALIFVHTAYGWELAAPPGFGTIFNLAILGLAEFGGSLYATTWNPFGGQIWRTMANGSPPFEWESMNLDGFGLFLEGWMPWATGEVDGEFYIGGWGTIQTEPVWDHEFGRGSVVTDTSSGFLFKSSDGVNFERVAGPGEGGWDAFPQIGISHMTSHRNKLYVLTQTFGFSGQIWVYELADGARP